MKKLLGIAVAAALAAPIAANAVVTTFSLNLTGAMEVPPVNSPAVGSATVAIDSTAGLIDVNLVALGLAGMFSAAHIHNAMVGENGPVVYDLGANADFSGPVTVGGFDVPNSHALVLDDASIDMTLAQGIQQQPWNYYINLHTDAYPDGELRGQLAPIPEPETYAMMLAGLGIVGWAAARRRKR